MNCCETCHPNAGCEPLFSDIMRPGMGRAAEILAYLEAFELPEPTDPPQSPAGSYVSSRFGAIKALVWVGISIGIGIALATLCS